MKHLIVMNYAVGEIDIIEVSPESAKEIDKSGDAENYVLGKLGYKSSNIEYMIVDRKVTINHFLEDEFLNAINDK